MTYIFTCQCGEVMTADAMNDEEAVQKLSATAKQHLAEVHPEMQKSNDEVHEDIRSNMKKGP